MAREPFLDALGHRVLLFDGAMGTEIQRLEPKREDYPGGNAGFNDGLVVTHPDWISAIHKSYLDAGADCIETNTFGSNKIKLAEYGMQDDTIEHNRKAAELASKAAAAADGPTRYVVGSMGPTGYLPSSTDPTLGNISLSEIREAFLLQAEGLVAGNVDALLIETSQDILEVKVAIEAAHEAVRSISRRVAIIANVTLDQYGKMLLGTDVEAAYTTVGRMGIDVFGINCSTGPAEMEPSVRWLAANSAHPLLIVPNAGMPANVDGVAVYGMEAGEFSAKLGGFLASFERVRIIGGCCGTRPEHISALRTIIDAGPE